MYPMNISRQTWEDVLSSFLGRVDNGRQDSLHVLSNIAGKYMFLKRKCVCIPWKHVQKLAYVNTFHVENCTSNG